LGLAAGHAEALSAQRKKIMYEIRDELNNVLGRPDSIPAAEQAIEEICAQVHAAAAAGGEGSADLWIHLRVIDGNGETVMFRDFNPDPTAPYRPLTGEQDQA
jgi:hypothetical protein